MTSKTPLGKTALITGASGGIGYELATVFAGHGWNLILVARSADKLREFSQNLSVNHGVTVHTLAKDLADPRAAQ